MPKHRRLSREGWVKLAVGKTLDRRGKQLTVKLQGLVEPYFRDQG